MKSSSRCSWLFCRRSSALTSDALRIHHLNVDATELPRRLLHATMQFPVKPGPMSLLYPKWIPGEHGPTGPDRRPGRHQNHAPTASPFLGIATTSTCTSSTSTFRQASPPRRRARFHPAARCGWLLLRRFDHFAARRTELEPDPALSERTPCRPAAIPGHAQSCRPAGAMARRSPSTANPATKSPSNPRRSPP